MFFINRFANTPFNIARVAVLGLVIVLSACSSSSSDDDVFVSSVPPTFLFFDFPVISGVSITDEFLGMSTTGDGSGFTAYGQAFWPAARGEVDSLDFAVNDDSPITQFPTGDNPYEWQHILAADFDIGPNFLRVTANIGNKQIVDLLKVVRGTSWMHEIAIQYDVKGARWLLLDRARRALLIVDLADGKRTVLSAAGVGSGVEFSEPVDFVVDSANDRALVVDRKLAAVIAVDLNTGTRSIFSGDGAPNAIAPFNEPVAIVLGKKDEDDAYVNAYIADRGHQNVIEMNLAGERVFIPAALNAEPAQISIPLDIAYHAGSNRLFVTDRILQNVIAIDLDDDSRTTFDDTNPDPDPESTTTLTAVSHLLVSDDVLYVSDTKPIIIAIDLDQDESDLNKLDGERGVLSDNSTPNGFNFFAYPSALAIDNTGPSRLLVIDNFWGVLTSVELTDIDNNGIGHRNYIPGGATKGQSVVNGESDDALLLSDRQAPTLGAVLQDPRGMIFLDDILITLDRAANRIVRIDPVSGKRSSLVQLETGTEFIDPGTLATDGIDLYVVDAATDQVTLVNNIGERTRLPSSTPVFAEPVDSAAAGDIAQASFIFDTLYVLDKTRNDIVAVNLLDSDNDGISDGERSLLGLNCLVEPVAMIWHAFVAENVNELLIIDRGASALLSVDLTSVTPSTACSVVAAIPAAVMPVDLALDVRAPNIGSYDPNQFDAGDWSVLILDAANSELIPIGIGGDNRGIVGPAYTPRSNMNDPFVSPIGLVFNNFNQRAYVLDNAILSAYTVDLRWRDAVTHVPLQVENVDANVNAIVDAQRVIFSRGTSLNCDADEAGELTACDFALEEE